MGSVSFMKKIIFNLLTIILGIIIVISIIIGFYSLFSIFDEKNQISKLQQYKILSNEETLKTINIKNKNYLITKYYDDTSSWSHLNIILKITEDYYLLEKIKKCDSSGNNIYIKENKIYIHCIGQKGNILEYEINDFKISKKVRHLNYDNTPNISQIHILIDKVDSEYIYLYSNVKINDLIHEGNKAKCSLKNNICNYY